MKSAPRFPYMFGLFLIIGSACAPEGELQRTIHPPHQKYLSRGAPPSPMDSESAPTGIALKPQLALAVSKGLPSTCSSEGGKDLCVRCQEDVWSIYRCYKTPKALDFASECQHTADYVKCLSKEPPFALYFDRHASHEKFLRENFVVWRDTVHQIWDGKFSAADKGESDRILKALDLLTGALSTRAMPSTHDTNAFVNALALKKEDEIRKANTFIHTLQTKRQEGKITLSLLLESMGEFYRGVHGPSSVWDELRTMSLEGLED